MGDRCSVTVTIGGKITQKQLEKLKAVIETHYSLTNWDYPTPDRRMTTPDIELEEINYGNVEEITDVCHEIGLHYHVWNGAGGGYGEGIEVYDGKERTTSGAGDGEPLVLARDVLEVKELAAGLGPLIERCRKLLTPTPPMELVD